MLNKLKRGIPLSVLFIPTLFMFSGCTSEPASKNPTYVAAKVNKAQLTDEDVFDSNLNHEITEEDIQRAIAQAEQGFVLPARSPVILVQSGATTPDSEMQLEMSKYYRVSVNSGVPPTKARINRKSDEPVIQNNYMRTLRLVGAKGRQKAIIVYWGTLETGKVDDKTNMTVWSTYTSGKMPSETKSIRYLLRFALVDVKTGNWVTYSPTNTEREFVQSSFNNQSSAGTQATQIDELKRNAYEFASRDLSTRYEKYSR